MIAFCCFLVSALLLLYTFAGYPALLRVRARLWPRPVIKYDNQLPITIVIAAHNEERVIQRKLTSIFDSDYQPEKLEVIVVSDGSTDATNAILSACKEPRVRLLLLERQVGKASALNAALAQATGQVIVFTDARQILERNSLRRLVANFADPTVGCASGQLMVGEIGESPEISGEGLKWKLENRVREWESAGGSVVGALGAFYGARRQLITEIPPGTLLDDCYLPLSIVRQGYRAVFEDEARVWDDVVTTAAQEFRRKVRTLTGNYQLLRLAPWLLTPRNPVLWEFVSHKLCRLIVPFLLALLLFASCAGPGIAYRMFATLQICAYALGALAWFYPEAARKLRPAEIARAVLVLNAATLLAFLNFLMGHYSVWTRGHTSRTDRLQTKGAQ